MTRVGFAVQFAGIAIAAATLLLMWKLSPPAGGLPGVSARAEASPWFLILAAGLVGGGMGSIRWASAGAGLPVIAAGTVAYGLISHRLIGASPVPVELSAGGVVAVGAVLAMIGLWVRTVPEIAGPSLGRQVVLSVAGVVIVGFLVWLVVAVWLLSTQQTPVHRAVPAP